MSHVSLVIRPAEEPIRNFSFMLHSINPWLIYVNRSGVLCSEQPIWHRYFPVKIFFWVQLHWNFNYNEAITQVRMLGFRIEHWATAKKSLQSLIGYMLLGKYKYPMFIGCLVQ